MKRLKNAFLEDYKTIFEQEHFESKELLEHDLVDNVKKVHVL